MPVIQGSVYPAELVSDTDLTGATVNLTVTAPDGTVTTPAAAISGSTATAQIPALLAGTYLLVWGVSGMVNGGVQDQFTVEAPAVDLVAISDLRDDLHLSDTSKDAKLRRWLKAATGVVENVTGPIRAHARTDWFDGGTEFVVLTTRWVSSITSVTETAAGVLRVLPEQLFGVSATVPSYLWDRSANIVYRRGTSGYGAMWQPGTHTVQIVYQAGLVTIPDEIQLATVELIRHWSRKTDTPFRSGPFGAVQGDDAVMVGNYMVPNAVMELLEPWRRLPGVA